MNLSEKRVAIVTGASSGIGLATARLFAASGHAVILVARREQRLKQLAEELERAGGTALVHVADLSKPDQCEAIVEAAMDQFGRIDVLVNNAGFNLQSLFEDLSRQEIRAMFDVNLMSLMELCRLVIPIMKRQKAGSIINIASVGGLMGHPLNAVYCASKHAVVGFTRSLNLELKGTGVRVTAVCPAGTKTEFFEVAEKKMPFPKSWSYFLAPPDRVARAILKASNRGGSVILPTLSAKAMIYMDRLLPFVSNFGNLYYRDLVSKMKRKS